jgi:hypothetical protein
LGSLTRRRYTPMRQKWGVWALAPAHVDICAPACPCIPTFLSAPHVRHAPKMIGWACRNVCVLCSMRALRVLRVFQFHRTPRAPQVRQVRQVLHATRACNRRPVAQCRRYAWPHAETRAVEIYKGRATGRPKQRKVLEQRWGPGPERASSRRHPASGASGASGAKRTVAWWPRVELGAGALVGHLEYGTHIGIQRVQLVLPTRRPRHFTWLCECDGCPFCSFPFHVQTALAQTHHRRHLEVRKAAALRRLGQTAQKRAGVVGHQGHAAGRGRSRGRLQGG